MTPVTPAKCTVGELSGKPESWIAEPKEDGARYLMYLGCDPYSDRARTTLLSRRISEANGQYVDQSAKVPHLAKLYPGLENTVLDGELVHGGGLAMVTSIVNSNSCLATAKQEAEGHLEYRVFDIPFYRGQDLRGQPLSKRRLVLEYVVQEINTPWITVLPQMEGCIESLFAEAVSRGEEGIVAKKLNAPYGVGWIKLKKSYDVSVIISGFTPGEGKYLGLIGSLILSVYSDTGELTEIGRASGFTDELRQAISKDQSRYMGRVVDVYVQQLSNPTIQAPLGRLRHAAFHRLRDDVSPQECTFTKLKAELRSQALAKRQRYEKNP